jgi:hypothetical protein
MQRIPLALALITATTGLSAVAEPALASVDPSITVSPKRLTLGETATIRGTSWVVGAGCAKTVSVRIRGSGWSAPVGRARVDASTGGIRLRFTPPQSKFPAGRTTLVATQKCPEGQGGDYVRKVKLTLVE